MGDEGELVFGISYSNKFKLVRQRLRDADKELKKNFMRAVRATVAPLKEEIPESARQKLPHKGGFAERIAKSKFAVRTKQSTVIVQIANPINLKKIDEGSLRHPVWGHMDRWSEQKIEPGFWSEPIKANEKEMLESLNEAMDETLAEIMKDE